MTDPSSKCSPKKILTILPLIAAILIVVVMVQTKKGPERLPFVELAKPVRTITINPVAMVPRVIGYGKAEPAEVWQAVAQVSGKILETNPILEQGNLCEAGTFLARIDPREYEVAVVRMEASIEEVEAKLTELKMEENNLKLSLSIEEKSLKISRTELARQEILFKNDTVPASRYDSEVKNYNSQLLKVQSLKNSLNLVPSNRKQLMASLALNRANLDDAKRDLENTVIKAPFNCRFTDVPIEIAQFVQKGQVIIVADGTGTAEVAAQIPIDKFFSLISASAPEMPFSAFDFSKIRDILGLSAIVKIKTGQFVATWEGRFSRPDAAIDQKTRTVGVIVAVDEPYGKIIPGKRPPLVRNMYCEVEISGKPLLDSIVIPRSALHQGIVHLVDKDNRLVRRKVVTGIPQSGFYVIKEGLEPGDRLIVSDIIPAIEGMLLKPSEDKETAKRLTAEALGKTEVR